MVRLRSSIARCSRVTTTARANALAMSWARLRSGAIALMPMNCASSSGCTVIWLSSERGSVGRGFRKPAATLATAVVRIRRAVVASDCCWEKDPSISDVSTANGWTCISTSERYVASGGSERRR